MHRGLPCSLKKIALSDGLASQGTNSKTSSNSGDPSEYSEKSPSGASVSITQHMRGLGMQIFEYKTIQPSFMIKLQANKDYTIYHDKVASQHTKTRKD